MLSFIVDIQRDIRGALSDDIAAFAAGGDWNSLLAVLPLGIVFGAAHALTPGHSKSVLAAYVAGSGLTRLRALLASFVLALTHVTSAVVLAMVANTLITRTIVGAGRVPALELTSRLALAAIGVWLLVRAIRHRPHIHGEGLTLGFVAGLIPCPLTLFIMTYAMSRGVPGAGLLFAVAMLVGVALVLGAVTLLAVSARSVIANLLASHGSSMAKASRALDAMAGAALTAVALHELTR